MATLLILAGLGFVLLLAEMFLPGGVLGVLGGILLLAAVAVGYVHWGPLGGTILFAGIGITCLAGFFVWMAIFPKTALGKRLILANEKTPAVITAPAIGSSGVTQTPLRPAGKALIDGVRVDVVTEGAFLEMGEPVSVVMAEGSRIVVRKNVGVQAPAA